MKWTTSVLGYGFLTWLIPFVAAIPLMSPDGTPRIDVFLFKKILVLVGTAVGSILLVRVISKSGENAVETAIVTGFGWLAVNLVLDFAILLPISRMDIRSYLTSIGIGYLTIPMMASAMGLAVSRSLRAARRTG